MKLKNIIEAHGNQENRDLNKTPAAGDMGEYISTAQAAKILGVSQSRVRQLIMDGRLKAHNPVKGRRDNFLKLSDVKAFNKKENHEPGRPTSSENED